MKPLIHLSYVASGMVLTAILLSDDAVQTLATWAQTPPAKTYQPGPFQPVARLDPKKPAAIHLKNQSGATLEVELVGSEVPATEMEPEDDLRSPLTLPIDLNISTPPRPPFTEISLNYQVTVDPANTLQVVVTITDEVASGDRVISVNETGAVYIY
jgi:hypothetical protein